MTQNRRVSFKFLSAALALAASLVWVKPCLSVTTPVGAAGSIQGYVTSSDKKCAEVPAGSFHSATKEELGSADSVTITNTKKQEVLGFGAAFTDAACYNLKDLSADARAKLFNDFFSSSEMGLSVCRICMGSSDYATKAYSYDDGDADPDMKRFSIAHDKQYILPMLKEARKVNPDLYLLASPWSPPGWMKANNSMLGGNIQRKSFEPYAKYFIRFLKSYEEAGVPVQAVSVQNEVDTDQDGRMPACLFPQEYEMDFVRQNLGPSIAKEGLKTKIWIIDHNYNLWGRAVDELEGDDMLKYVGGVAWHGYVGSPSLMTRVHNAFPNVDMFWTEGGPDYTQADYGSDWVKWSSSFSGILNNWCKSIIAWNLALDEVGKPNIGPFPCGGVVTINSKSKEITHSGQYWALKQYSRFIKRGARVIETEHSVKDFSALAAENTDGKKVFIATNAGGARDINLIYDGKAAKLHLEPNSVSTFVW